MIKITIIFGLIMSSSLTSFGQEVIGYGTIAKGSAELRDFPLPGGKQLTETDGPVVIDIKTAKSDNFDRADPLMPIVVPPKNLYSKFPIKIIPEDFPSDMPIYGLKNNIRRWEKKECVCDK